MSNIRTSTKRMQTPWHVEDDIALGIKGADDKLGVAFANRGQYDIDAANAAFIVHAVNSHEQLVAALRDNINYAEACDDGSIKLHNARATLAASEA